MRWFRNVAEAYNCLKEYNRNEAPRRFTFSYKNLTGSKISKRIRPQFLLKPLNVVGFGRF